MARLADEELKKAFGEHHEKMVDTTQKLKLADIQIESLKRSKQRAELTIAEITKLPSKTKTYESVGRMFLLDDIKTIKAELQKRMETADAKITTVENNKTYLEQSLHESKKNLGEMIQQKRDKESSS